jgi:hypothetical protein
MKNMIKGKRLRALGLFALLCLGALSLLCRKEEKPGGEIRPPEGGETITEAQLTRITGDLLDLQEKIRQQPQDVTLRQQLVAAAVDRDGRRLLAAGLGKVPAESPSSAMASQGAERAAFIDGCRWIAYLQAWEKNPETPVFGAIQGQIPPAKIIYKHTTPDQIVVLVEAKF